jgi:hypothetical protein
VGYTVAAELCLKNVYLFVLPGSGSTIRGKCSGSLHVLVACVHCSLHACALSVEVKDVVLVVWAI